MNEGNIKNIARSGHDWYRLYYLRDDWLIRRRQLLSDGGGCCRYCMILGLGRNERNLEVHHKNYKYLGEEHKHPECYEILCAAHHGQEHVRWMNYFAWGWFDTDDIQHMSDEENDLERIRDADDPWAPTEVDDESYVFACRNSPIPKMRARLLGPGEQPDEYVWPGE